MQQRTLELSEAINDLEDAREAAETANRSKTRFLAAASHDLLQPMNAARLFVSLLRQQAGEGMLALRALPDGAQALVHGVVG